MTVFTDIWDFITGFLETALDFVVQMLPPSPFSLIDNSPIKPYLGWLNWAFPVNEIITTLETWVVAIGIFYAYQAVLRWVKAIE